MRSPRPLAPLVLLSWLAACASSGSGAAGEPASAAGADRDLAVQDLAADTERNPDPSVATIPFTAAQIRAGCAPGTVMVQRIASEGAPTVLRTTRFLRGDDERVAMEATTTLEDGTPAGPPQEVEAAWAELRDHARFPAAMTTRTRATCEVPAGAFDCWLYTIDRSDEDGAVVDRLYFAPAHPGPPVLFETERDGRVVMRMELLELRHEDPRG